MVLVAAAPLLIIVGSRPARPFDRTIGEFVKTLADELRTGQTAPDKFGLAYETRLAATKQEAAEWEKKYRDTLNKLALIEYHLRGHPTVNLDIIYATPMPPPDRSEPYQPSGHKRGYRRRD